MKFVVTGGAGFVGSYLVKLLIDEGHSVIVIDNLVKGKKSNLESVLEKIEFHQVDIRDYEALEKILNNIDGVFHQAALTVVQDSFTRPEEYHEVNVIGTENIFKLAKENNFKIVYASSSSVYGNPIKIPIKESDEKIPINPYAETKLKKEKLATKYSEMGVKIIGLRYFNVFGKRQSKEYAGVIKLFLQRINDKLPPKINGDGTQFRDFVHVSDVVNANIMSMSSKINHDFFNVGTNTSITILDLAKVVIEYSGLKLEPIFEPALKGDVQKTIADIDLIKEKLGWEPKITLVDWIKEIISSNKINQI